MSRARVRAQFWVGEYIPEKRDGAGEAIYSFFHFIVDPGWE